MGSSMPILEPSRPRTIIHWIQKTRDEYIPSQANFILTKPGDGRSLFLELRNKELSRALGPTLADYAPIGRDEEENIRLLSLEQALSQGVIMSVFNHSLFPSSFTLILWVLCLLTGLYLGVFRSMIDRIRAGISHHRRSQAGKLLDSILGEPNHARRFVWKLPFFFPAIVFRFFLSFLDLE